MTNEFAILRIAHMLKEVSLSMRMIDRFRTPKQREIISYLEKNHLCRVSDVGDISNYHKHFRALLEEGVIYICGYVGCKNQQVYALVRREQ